MTMIPADKKLHLAVGAVIGLIVTVAGIVLGLHYVLASVAGVAVAAAIGYAKERYDAAHPESHTADRKDLYATAIGGVVGAGIGTLIRFL
jgi:hypothetical protein